MGFVMSCHVSGFTHHGRQTQGSCETRHHELRPVSASGQRHLASRQPISATWQRQPAS